MRNCHFYENISYAQTLCLFSWQACTKVLQVDYLLIDYCITSLYICNMVYTREDLFHKGTPLKLSSRLKGNCIVVLKHRSRLSLFVWHLHSQFVHIVHNWWQCLVVSECIQLWWPADIIPNDRLRHWQFVIHMWIYSQELIIAQLWSLSSGLMHEQSLLCIKMKWKWIITLVIHSSKVSIVPLKFKLSHSRKANDCIGNCKLFNYAGR